MVGMLVRCISTQTDEVEASECFWMQSSLPFSQSANDSFLPGASPPSFSHWTGGEPVSVMKTVDF